MDWKNITEALPLILVLLVWIISRVFGKKEDDEQPQNAEPVVQEAHQEEAIAIEEEIRRKIAQRQEEAQRPFEQAQTPLPETAAPLMQQNADTGNSWWEEQLRNKRRQLRDSQEAATQARQQLAKTASSSKKTYSSRSTRSQQIRSSSVYKATDKLPLLKNPQTLRQAFLYAEILGPPPGLRKSERSFQSSFWSAYE